MRKAGKPTVSSSLLHRRIQETYTDSSPSVDQIVDRVREKYPEYRRHKLQRFTRMVKQSINQKSKRKYEEDSRSVSSYDDDDENTSQSLCSPVGKKAKKVDTREQMLETKHFTTSESESELFPESESESVSVDGEEDRRAVLTSEKPKYMEISAQKPNKLSNDDDFDANGKDDGPRYKDFGGIDAVIKDLKRMIMPLHHPQQCRMVGVKPVTGILLHGPPGCGKTTLARAIANENGFPLYQVSAPDLVSGISGGSEENIRELFSKAYKTAPSVVFIDEIDAIASKRENLQRGSERRTVTQLMTCMEQSHRGAKPHVLVIGTTNTPNVLDPALRRPGRFDREIALGVPDEKARLQILKVLTRDLRMKGDIDLVQISRATPGYVGVDLETLVSESGVRNMWGIMDERKLKVSNESEENEDCFKEAWTAEENEKLGTTMLDLEGGLTIVQPSLKREGFSSIPNVKWEDVGGLDNLRREFDRCIVRRIKDPDGHEEFGINLETGFLLYGPPGCGKTLIAKAIANEARVNFIYVKGPELLNKYVGESESAVRAVFDRARKCAPCILFFDEVDSLTRKRGKEGGWTAERLLHQLLVELDGADERKGVYVIGATNRPEAIDDAILRPGRLGKHLYVPLPSPDERGLILEALARKKPIDDDVDLIAIGRNEACENFSGADLSALMHEAAMAAYAENYGKSKAANERRTIKAPHFEQAFGKVSPSVSDKQKRHYRRFSKSFKAL